ncbi:MAG: PD40 domain-containing protein, partial [Candidatus Latescibacterota bacterium]
VMRKQAKLCSTYPPLWFVEGLAVFIACNEADSRCHMFVRDALLHNQLPDLANLWRIEGSFLMYKQGEAIVRYIAQNFGDEALTKILENWWVSEDFPLVLKRTINMDLMELNDAFFMSLKRRYYPSILYSNFAPDIGQQLTQPRSFHSRPTAAREPDGDISVYALGAEDGVISVVRFSKDDKGRLKRKVLIEGSRSVDFESIPAFRSKMEVKGDTLLFVSKRHDKDAVYLWTLKKKHPLEKLTFPDLSVISSPTLSPDGSRVVFSAIDRTGQMDLFIYNLITEQLDRLTNDAYAEQDPDYHPYEDRVVFASDRCRNATGQAQGIYMVDVRNRRLTPLTCGAGKDAYPEWAPDGGGFLFSSDRDGVFNIYFYNMDSQKIVKQTSVIGGVTMPSFLPDQSGFVASAYFKGEYQIFEFPIKEGEGLSEQILAADDLPDEPNWKKKPQQEMAYKTEDYKMKLGMDFAGAGVAIDPNFGSLGNGGQVVLTDILGNHQFYMFVANSSEGVDNFFSRLNVGVNYVNLTRRLHYSLGVFHLNSFVRDAYATYRAERRYGVSTGLSYPFSRFTRVDGSLVVRMIERQLGFAENLPVNRSFVATAFFSHVVDKTLWTIGGPLKGWRYYVTVGHTFDFRNRGFENTSLHFDVRKYFKITDRIILAERFLTRNSFGSDFEIFYLGGPWDFRGYEFREFFGRTTFLLNNELRFPLIDRFALGLPFGTIETPMLRGSLFFDVGQTSRYIADTPWLGSFGAGVELNLGYAPVIRVNFTRLTDFSTISDNTKLGLFLGYNY